MVLSHSWPIRLRATAISLRSVLCGSWSAAGLFPAAVTFLALVLLAATVGNGVAEAQPEWRLPEKALRRVLHHEGIVVQVTPLLVEPVMGFLIGRGFPFPIAQRYAASCVIRVVMRNESAPAPISYDLRSWRTRRPDGALSPLFTREDWMRNWRTSPLSNTSLMGFEWSQLPTMQELHNGDSTQGMVNTGLATGSHFDLLLEWVSQGNTNRYSLEGVACAPPS
jgi:hypothetical protein